MFVNQLKEKRSAVIAKAQEITAKAEKETRSLTAEEKTQFDGFMKEAEDLKGDIARAEQLETETRSLNTSAGRRTTPSDPNGGEAEYRGLGVPQKDLAKYSVLRAIRCITNNKPLDGIEGELSQEIAKRSGKAPKGFFMPMEITTPREYRTDPILNTTVGAGALNSGILFNSFIEMLRAKALVTQLGARMIGGLVGSFGIPKQTAGGSTYWVAEGGDVTPSTPTVGSVPLVAKTIGALSDMTRAFINQTGLDAEAFVRNDLAMAVGLGIDKAALVGGDTNGPDGILNITQVPTLAIGSGALDFAHAVAMETQVATSNADIGALAYVTTPGVRGKLKTTLEAASTGSSFIWRDNQVNGYNAQVTTQMPGGGSVAHSVIFGNWNDLIIAMWGGLDVLVDPYTLSKSGGVRIVTLQDVDIKVRNAESFVKTVDIEL